MTEAFPSREAGASLQRRGILRRDRRLARLARLRDRADPRALVSGYSHAAMTLNFVRAEVEGSKWYALPRSLEIAADGRWQADLALGNVVGSNIFNVLFILGASALLASLLVSRPIIQREVPIMIGVSVLLWVLALDGRVSRLQRRHVAQGRLAVTRER